RKLARCHAKTPQALSFLESVAGDFEIGVALDKRMMQALAPTGIAPERVVAIQPNYDLASTAKERDIEGVRAALRALPTGLTTENIPKCLAGERARPTSRTADAAVLGPDGRVVMAAFTQRFIEDGFYSKPVRCAGCTENESCAGVHVNWVRAHGFEELEPIRGPG
ncbi:MAG: hypothetical protein HOV80_32670, partial [Polyangiaceae bacterium]|nr:hypothetical protein [Polyangiaceae bacterium]